MLMMGFFPGLSIVKLKITLQKGYIVFARKSQISEFRGCGGRHLGEFGGHFEA